FDNGDIDIIFGEHNPEKHKDHKGNVYPYCGALNHASLRVVEPTTWPFHDGADFIPYRYLAQLVWLPWEGGAVAASGMTFETFADIVTNRTLPLYKDLSQPMPGAAEKYEIIGWY